MLRTTVSLRRKARRDGGTESYAVTLNGEIPFGPDDAEGVLEKVAELFHLADEALAREIDRDRECPPVPRPEPTPHRPASPPASRPTGHGHPQPKSDAATPKQVQYLLNLAKRNGLSRDELDAVTARVTGSPKKTGDLTKRDAGAIIDHLTNLEPEAAK
jgi:hypothetical protein